MYSIVCIESNACLVVWKKKFMNCTASERSQYQLQATATLAFCSVIIFEWLVLGDDPNNGCIGNYQLSTKSNISHFSSHSFLNFSFLYFIHFFLTFYFTIFYNNTNYHNKKIIL